METSTLFIVEIADRSLHSRLKGICEESHRYFAQYYSTFPQHPFEKSQPRNVREFC